MSVTSRGGCARAGVGRRFYPLSIRTDCQRSGRERVDTILGVTPENLADAVLHAAKAVFAARDLDVSALPGTVTVERPRNPEHGDYATNLALQVAKKVGANPRDLAGALADALREHPGIASVEIAGPGFLNVRVDAAAAGELARTVVIQGQAYGCSEAMRGLKLNLEFVSANPTGPIHLGGVRWAAVGDALARLL